jgi:hypothetical protein
MAKKPGNPVRDLRYALSPTSKELSKRSVRDQGITHLLQRELAKRIGCTKYCVGECEQLRRFPRQLLYRANAMTLYESLFQPYDDGGESLEETRRQIDSLSGKA